MNFEDRYGGNVPVIVIEPARAYSSSPEPSGPQPRAPEINPQTASTAKSFREWFREEAAWGTVHFVRALFTVVVYRGLYHLFTKGIASQQAYDQAPDLWMKGKRDTGFRRGNSTSGYRGNGNGNGSSFGFGPSPRGPRSDPPWWSTGGGTEARAESESTTQPPKLGRVGAYTVFDNRTVLDRATQFWCCPLLYRTPCEKCRFMEADQSGTNHCAAVIKATMLRRGEDDGSDLEEIREQIRREV